MSNFDQSLSRMFYLLHKGFESTFAANKNWGRWSDMVAVMFSDITSHERTLEKILPMRVLEWLVSFVGCKMYGMLENLEIHWWVGVHYSLTNHWWNLQEEKLLFVLLKSYQVVD